MESIKKATCRSCINQCGVKVYVRDGKVTKIDAENENPWGYICEKAMAAPEFHNHPSRLNYPLKRAGKRGEGKWQRISWSQAMDEIADRIKGIREKYGPEAVAIFGGTFHGPCDWSSARWCNLFGTPNFIYQGKNCGEAEILAECAIYGYSSYSRRVVPGLTKCLVAWGWNPTKSSPNMWEYLIKGRKNGMKLVAVDPRYTRCAAEADLWLQVRPGADGALALGMLNVIINEGLYDKDFVKKWCLGFSEIKNLVQKYPPKKVEDICWVPEEKIKKAARMYATNKPAMITRTSVTSKMSTAGKSLALSKTILRTITGNIDVEGGNVLGRLFEKFAWLENMHYDRLVDHPMRKRDNVSANKYPIASIKAYKLFCEAMKRVHPLGYGAAMYMLVPSPVYISRAIAKETPYPIKAVIIQGSNPLLTLGNAKKFYEAFKSKKLDLHVSMDFFMTPTAQIADYVLPAADWLESPNISLKWNLQENYVCGERSVDPLYERRDDYQFWCDLGLRLGQDWPENIEAMFDLFLKPTGLNFKEFMARKDHWYAPLPKYRKYEEKGFATFSGKAELVPSIFKMLGYDPLPRYVEPARSPIRTPELAKKYPQILISGARVRGFLHSMYRQIERLRKLYPEPLLEINTETATKLNISNGDWVYIETPEGRISQKAKLTNGIHPKVVHSDAYWWFPEKCGTEPDLFGVWESNVNAIVPDNPDFCDYAGDNYFNGLLCRVYKVPK